VVCPYSVVPGGTAGSVVQQGLWKGLWGENLSVENGFSRRARQSYLPAVVHCQREHEQK
jgi:hypothetical protein